MPRIEASATTVTLLPGHSEDTPGDGHRLDSAMPDYRGKTLDAWFTADQVTDYPEALEEVLAMRRDLPEYDEGLRQYRLRNHLALSFTTTDGESVVGPSVDLETNADDESSYVAVEGQRGEGNVVRDIIESEELDWFDGEEKLRAETDRFESGVVRESALGIEGVRASAVYGGRDTYVVRMKEKFDELGPVTFLEKTGMDEKAVPAFIVQPPTMYTFLDLVTMADGSKLARMWDASPYPKQYLYVDEHKRAATDFEEGEHWEPREDMNRRFGQWVMEEQSPETPFSQHVGLAYEEYVDFLSLFEPYRAMYYGEDGDRLTTAELMVSLPTPLFPWGTR